jgi:hypothetical protein
VVNQTKTTLTFTSGSISHGNNPNIVVSTLESGHQATVFIANSDGAGVEGNVSVSGDNIGLELYYDNPVVGSNSGDVTINNAPRGFSKQVNVGSGDNNTITYTLSVG